MRISAVNYMKLLKNSFPILLFTLFVFLFFLPVFKDGKIPFPADTLVGLYHPWRDAWSQYPQGIPYKNPLITDPVRQQYPYRLLSIEQLKAGIIPKWNPYVFSGTPQLANIQSATFYPLNFIFSIFPFPTAWTVLILLQPLLAGIFLYAYLVNLQLDERAASVAAVAFAFSGFMVAWLTWNTLDHVLLWLPLILLAKDKLIQKTTWYWAGILIFAQVSMLLGGHFQTAFYVLIFSSVYLWLRLWQKSEGSLYGFIKRRFIFILTGITTLLITGYQLLSSFIFIRHSARLFDLPDWHRSDWFLPPQHLIQFLAPDYFGNPATGNYWGIWNYGEFVGYIGMLPLLFALFALFARRDKKTWFFSLGFLATLLLALPTFIAKVPYWFSVPFFSTLQPSRIMSLTVFCLSVLAGLGYDYLMKHNISKPTLWGILTFPLIGMMLLWVAVLFPKTFFPEATLTLMDVSKRNLILPTVFFILSGLLVSAIVYLKKYFLNIHSYLFFIVIGFIFLDLFRFAVKFTPFTDRGLLYPNSSTINYLQEHSGYHRFMATDRRILPPNVSTFYKLLGVEGYDPLYLSRYGEYVAAWTRGNGDISPAPFNRILTPTQFDSVLARLAGVKYVLSLTDLVHPRLKLVHEEGVTRIYENEDVLPRAFLVAEIRKFKDRMSVMNELFAHAGDVRSVAFTEVDLYVKPGPLHQDESAQITSYKENQVIIKTHAQQERLLVLTDVYYPDWRVYIDGQPSEIFPVDFLFRGVVVPPGLHTVEYVI